MLYLEDIFFYLKKFFFHESQTWFLGRHQIGGRLVLRYKNAKITPQAWVLSSPHPNPCLQQKVAHPDHKEQIRATLLSDD